MGTDIAYCNEVHVFIDSIPEVGQQQYKEFVNTHRIRYKNLVSDTVTKKNLTPAKLIAKADPKKTSTLKESDFNRLRMAALFLLSLFQNRNYQFA